MEGKGKNGRPSHISTRLHGLCRPRLALLFVIQLFTIQIIIFIAAAACLFLLRMIGCDTAPGLSCEGLQLPDLVLQPLKLSSILVIAHP